MFFVETRTNDGYIGIGEYPDYASAYNAFVELCGGDNAEVMLACTNSDDYATDSPVLNHWPSEEFGCASMFLG